MNFHLKAGLGVDLIAC